MFHKKQLLVTVLVMCGSLTSCCNCSADKLESVLMPDAYVIGRVHLSKIQQSSIVKLMRKDEAVSSKIKVDKLNTVLKKYDLSDKDFTSFVVGLKLNIKNIKNFNDALLKNDGREFVFGIQSSKPITLEQLKKIVIDSSKQDKEINVKVQSITKDGVKLLLIKDKGENTVQPLVLAVEKKEKIIVGGSSPKTVISSLKRIKAGKTIGFNAELNKLKSEVSKKADFYLLGYIPEAIRKKTGLGRQEEPKKSDKEDNKVSIEVLKDINALSIQADFMDKKVGINIYSYFISRKSAQDAHKLLNQFLPMLKFLAMGVTQGVTLPILDSIGNKLSKLKPELKINFTFTEQDYTSIQEIAKKKEMPKINIRE
jgi:hypothetical protein